MKKNDPRQMTLLDLVSPATRTCADCGGTILAPTIGGVRRGSCHCKPERKPIEKSAPRECCLAVIATYETLGGGEMARVAKSRVGHAPVRLFCKVCIAGLQHDRQTDTWIREGV